MAKSRGRLGTVTVDDGVVASPENVGGIVSIDWSWPFDVIDCTSFDSAGNKEVEYGERQATLSLTLRLDEANAGQDLVADAHEGPTTLTVVYSPEAATGRKQYSFTGLVTSFEISNARNEVVEASVEIQSSGAITVSTQA